MQGRPRRGGKSTVGSWPPSLPPLREQHPCQSNSGCCLRIFWICGTWTFLFVVVPEDHVLFLGIGAGEGIPGMLVAALSSGGGDWGIT